MGKPLIENLIFSDAEHIFPIVVLQSLGLYNMILKFACVCVCLTLQVKQLLCQALPAPLINSAMKTALLQRGQMSAPPHLGLNALPEP